MSTTPVAIPEQGEVETPLIVSGEGTGPIMDVNVRILDSATPWTRTSCSRCARPAGRPTSICRCTRGSGQISSTRSSTTRPSWPVEPGRAAIHRHIPAGLGRDAGGRRRQSRRGDVEPAHPRCLSPELGSAQLVGNRAHDREVQHGPHSVIHHAARGAEPQGDHHVEIDVDGRRTDRQPGLGSRQRRIVRRWHRRDGGARFSRPSARTRFGLRVVDDGQNATSDVENVYVKARTAQGVCTRPGPSAP